MDMGVASVARVLIQNEMVGRLVFFRLSAYLSMVVVWFFIGLEGLAFICLVMGGCPVAFVIF